MLDASVSRRIVEMLLQVTQKVLICILGEIRGDQGSSQDGAKVWFSSPGVLFSDGYCPLQQHPVDKPSHDHSREPSGLKDAHCNLLNCHLAPLHNPKSHCFIKARSTIMAPPSTLPCWIRLKWDLLVLLVTLEANRTITAKFFSSDKKTLFHLSMFPVRYPLAKWDGFTASNLSSNSALALLMQLKNPEATYTESCFFYPLNQVMTELTKWDEIQISAYCF